MNSIEVNDGQGFGYNGFEGLALGKASDGTTVQNTLQSDFDENTDEHYLKQMQNLESINRSDLIR